MNTPIALVARSRVSRDARSRVGGATAFTGGEAAAISGGAGAFETVFGAGEGAGAGAGGAADATAGGAAVTEGGATAAGEGVVVICAQPASARATMEEATATTTVGLIALTLAAAHSRSYWTKVHTGRSVSCSLGVQTASFLRGPTQPDGESAYLLVGFRTRV